MNFRGHEVTMIKFYKLSFLYGNIDKRPTTSWEIFKVQELFMKVE